MINDNQKSINGKIFSVFLTLALFLQLPAFAFWGNKPLPRINSQAKIDYVNIDWWENFSDPYLKEYIIKAVKNNHDAKKASWQVEEYKQNIKVQFSQELPSLSVRGSYILNHSPNIFSGIKNNIFIVPFVAGYEADVFLKNHDKTKSAKKAYEASKYQEKSIYIALASGVATTYINIIKFDKQIQIQEDFVKLKEEELRRAELKYKRGVIPAADFNNYKKDYNSAKNDLNDFVKSRDIALNQLSVLLGESSENTALLKRSSWDCFEYKNAIPSSISSDVIFSRPDVLSTEANLEKANIDIRVARKEFLPRFNITGIYSLSNLGTLGFGSWGDTLAALAASAALDLFKGGQKIANLKISKARYEQMFESYMQTALNAVKEVNDGMLILKEDFKITTNTNNNLKIQYDNYKRAEKRYQNGVISCPELLLEQEKFLSMQQNQINKKAAYFIDYITLYQAAGGKL